MFAFAKQPSCEVLKNVHIYFQNYCSLKTISSSNLFLPYSPSPCYLSTKSHLPPHPDLDSCDPGAQGMS